MIKHYIFTTEIESDVIAYRSFILSVAIPDPMLNILCSLPYFTLRYTHPILVLLCSFQKKLECAIVHLKKDYNVMHA